MDLLEPKLEIFSDRESENDDQICDGNYSSISDLKSKNATHKNPGIMLLKKYKKKRQICSVCSVSYSKREYLSKHMKMKHNVILEKKRPGRVSQFKVHENDPRPYKCDQCVKEYTKSKHLARHRRTHLEMQRCHECNEICNNYADHMLKKHGIDTPRPFQCDICHKNYRTKTHIQSHMRIHRAVNRIFACTVCPKTFCFATDLRKHMKTHSQNRSVICDICGDAFKSADTLKCHMRRHTGERPYKCLQCPRAFSTSSSLDIHFRTHTGEKPFQCEFCSKRFSDSSTLLVHKRLHTNENPYMCHLCGRRTKQASNLRSHYKHFHKNNDISGRQIRLNSRIFNRFSQSEIDVELQNSGDLMDLLERGLQEFYREEKEKTSQIEKALQVMITPQTRNLTLNVENDAKREINSVDGPVDVKIKEKNTNSIPNSLISKNPGNKLISKLNHEPNPLNISSVKHRSPGMVSGDNDCSRKKTDIPYNRNMLNDNLMYESSDSPVKKGLLKIESVFIEDLSCSQPEIEIFSIDDVKEGNHSDNDMWPNETYENSSLEPIQTIKQKLFATEHPEKPSSIVSINGEIRVEKTDTEDIKIDVNGKKDATKNVQQNSSRSKMEALKSEMERCEACNRRFHDLAKHWIRFHSGIERPYECYICNRDYKRFEHLKYHMRTHGNERNYVCHVCGDAFFLSSELRKHIINRHQVDRPFNCTFQQCKKCFKNKHALNVHMRIHSSIKPYVCTVCFELFSALSSLKIHQRKHSGDRPYSCKFCKKAFADSSTLRQHERIHTGEKPYRCHLCDRRTAQAGNLKSHYRHYHKIIVKSVSMYVDPGSFSQEFQRNLYERSATYPITDLKHRIEE